MGLIAADDNPPCSGNPRLRPVRTPGDTPTPGAEECHEG